MSEFTRRRLYELNRQDKLHVEKVDNAIYFYNKENNVLLYRLELRKEK